MQGTPDEGKYFTRIDLDCIVPYLTLAKSMRLPILLCKIANLAGAPERTVRYLWSPTIPHCRTPQFCRTRCLRAKLSILRWETLGIKSYGSWYCSFGKMENLGTNVDFFYFYFYFKREGPSPRGTPSIPPFSPSFFLRNGSN